MSAFVLHDRFFDPETGRISSYFCQLFVLLGQDSFQYAILDSDKNAFLALAAYRSAELPGSTEALYGQLEAAFSADSNLHRKYPSVVIGIDTPFHTLVPAAFFEKDSIGDYLGFNFSLPGNNIAGHDRVTEIDAENIFGYQPELEVMIRKNFPGAVMVHRSTAFLKTAFQHHLQSGTLQGMYLNLRNPFIDIASFEGHKAVFFNSFSCRSKEDVLYFTLYTLEQLKLRPESVNLSLCGSVDAGSEIYTLLEQYIRPVGFTGLPGSFNYSPLLKQVPGHLYSELFGLALCGS